MSAGEVASAAELDALLFELNDHGAEPVVPVLDAEGNSGLAYVQVLPGGNGIQTGVAIGGPDVTAVLGARRDQPTSWLTYPVTVLHTPSALAPGAGPAVPRRRTTRPLSPTSDASAESAAAVTPCRRSSRAVIRLIDDAGTTMKGLASGLEHLLVKPGTVWREITEVEYASVRCGRELVGAGRA